MTDYEKFTKLLSSVGCEFKITDGTDIKVLILEEGMEKVVGYNGFFLEIVFDKNDKFVNIGAYE